MSTKVSMRRMFFMVGLLTFLSGLFSAGGADGDYPAAETHAGLRDMVFALKPADLGIEPRSAGEVWGVLMETGHDKAVATLVALADGTVSLYFSNGGGILGSGEHDGPRRAAFEFLVMAQRHASELTLTSTFPLPRRGFTRFYVLTGTGVLTAEVKEDDLGNNRHPLSPLFHDGQDVISAVHAVKAKP